MKALAITLWAGTMIALTCGYIWAHKAIKKCKVNREHLDFFGKIHREESRKALEAIKCDDFESALKHFDAAQVAYHRAIKLPHPEVLD